MTDSAASMECGKCRRTFTVDEFFDHECPPTSAASMECGKCRRTFTVDEFFDHECPPTSAAPRRCWWRGHKWTRWELRSMSVENGWGDMVTGDRNERRCLRCGVVKRRKP